MDVVTGYGLGIPGLSRTPIMGRPYRHVIFKDPNEETKGFTILVENKRSILNVGTRRYRISPEDCALLKANGVDYTIENKPQ